MRFALCTLRLVWLLPGTFGMLPAAASDREDLLLHLSGYEWRIEDVPRLEAAADQLLLGIVQDPLLPAVTRARAEALLVRVPTNAVWRYLVARIADSQSTSEDQLAAVARRRQIEVYCDAFGATRPAEVAEQLAPLLLEQNQHLRISTARCLGRLDASLAREALRTFGQSTTDPWTRRAAGLPRQGEEEP